MSKMSELSLVLDELITCGENMIKAANTLKEIFSSTTEETTAAPAVKTDNGLATLFWTKLLRTRNYFNYSSYPADFRVFNPLYSTGVR
ncbi:MAG: hypothetical protein GX963_15635 [Bacteroidales bacterium]|nr:hypothetical protein [Bacteroidales bacterium]